MNALQLNALSQELVKKNLDAILIFPSADLQFLIGYSPFLCYRFQGLFVTSSGEFFYVCNRLTQDEMIPVMQGYPVYAWHDSDGYLDTVALALETHDLVGKKIGVNKHVSAFTVLDIAAHIDVTFVNAGDLCDELRIRKTAEEISAMQKAARISETAFHKLLPQILPGMTEGNIRDILTQHMSDLEGEAPAAMVASGPNGGYAHYQGNSRILCSGDAIIIDFGCAWNGLRTDITRTIFLGKPSAKQLALYQLVRRANEAAENLLKDGCRWIPDIDAAARNTIAKEGLGTYFTTRLGHGIGRMGHEAPDIKGSHKRMLEPGMSFTIEPGIYIPNDIGIRIEDCVVIDLDGKSRILSDGITKEPIILPL